MINKIIGRQATLMAGIAMLALFSCSKENHVRVEKEQPLLPAAVESQIAAAKVNLQQMGIPATVAAYKFESVVNSEGELENLKKSLRKGENVVPVFDGVNVNSFMISTIQDRMSLFRQNKGEEENVIRNIEDLVFPELKTGQKVLTLSWNVAGKQFDSRCVYTDGGIVYDHMLSNIIMLQEEKATSGRARSTGAAGEVRRDGRELLSTTVKDISLLWLWGSVRGKIIIKHEVLWNGSDYIYDNGGYAEGWMVLGSAGAQYGVNSLDPTSHSKMAWAYGYATPTARFGISWHVSSLTFSTTLGGIGSKGAGSGVHIFSL